MAIQNLNQGDATTASQFPFWDPQNGQDRRTSLAQIAEVLQASLSTPPGLVTQYAAPGATGFTVTVEPPTAGASVFLLLSPGGSYAAGTLVLPVGVEGQQITVHCRQPVAALTVTPASGENVSGAPTALTAGGFFTLRFDEILSLWCRIG